MDPAPEITPVDLTLESAVRPLVQPSIRSFFVKVSEDEHRTLLALQAVREREKEVAENRMIALPLHNNIAVVGKRKFDLVNGGIVEAHAFVDYVLKSPSYEDGLKPVKVIHERPEAWRSVALIHVPEGREEENFDADEPAAAAAAGEA